MKTLLQPILIAIGGVLVAWIPRGSLEAWWTVWAWMLTEVIRLCCIFAKDALEYAALRRLEGGK